MGDCGTGASGKAAAGGGGASSLLAGGCSAQVMPGDIVRSSLRGGTQRGWVCCVTPESNEGHVYWQPHEGNPSVDSREPLSSLHCVDRALIPGDIVRRCDVSAGESHDSSGRDRDDMGMVVGTEVMLDLREVDGQELGPRSGVPASSVRHHVPIRLASWVVHRSDGWLGRMQSWDEDLVIRFPPGGASSTSPGGCRCRIRAANQKQGVSIVESFYRDFFPGLRVSVNVQEMQNSSLEVEWLSGDLQTLLASNSVDVCQCEANAPVQRVQAVIEEVTVGAARVEWLTQVPLWRGWSSERPPRSDGCHDDKLIFLMGEAECSSRWALGDRVRHDSVLAEVCGVETFLDVRWQDDALSVRVPARELQLCNPDAFSFFPSELICQRSLEEAGGVSGANTPFRSGTPLHVDRGSSDTGGEKSARGGGDGADRPRNAGGRDGAPAAADEKPPRIGFVTRADPASRMVSVRWLDDGAPSNEEEWSAFDLQIDPEFGFRLGDAVIRCRDWEQPSRDSDKGGPRVGQVVALEAGSVRVRWLDSVVSLHAPRELYRVGDEDEGSVAESQDGGNGAGDGEAIADVVDGAEDASSRAGTPLDMAAGRSPTPGDRNCSKETMSSEAQDDDGTCSGSRAGGAHKASGGGSSGSHAPNACNGRAGAEGRSEAIGDKAATGGDAAATEDASAAVANGGTAGGSSGSSAAAAPAASGAISFDDMCWESLPTDHHFIHCTSPTGPSNRQFLRRVQREWAILQQGLPYGVWVHVYPDRMELLRACLVGPEGTPYSDALFFFDVHLPPTYPQIPPQVRFWSFGENLNPNLYENGKVCLSLLGTWSGKDSETWSPERSNLLQVLVSILGLVLNTEPYYNEPGFERERDTPQGLLRSQRYNESVALSSYHLTLRVLRSPPCDFDRPVKKHFAERRDAILARARRLREGIPDGGDMPAGEGGEVAICSEGFKKSLDALLPRLAEALPEEPP